MYAYIMSVSASTPWLRSIFPFEQELRTACLTRKHFWSRSTFKTKNIHIPCFFLPAHSTYDRYFLWNKNYEPHTFYRKHFWCFPHLERRIYTYLVCFCQRTLATIDIPYRARIMNHTRFIESISAVFHI